MTMRRAFLPGLLLISAQFAFAEDAPFITNDSLQKYDGMPAQQWSPNNQPATDTGYEAAGTRGNGGSANEARQRQSYCDQATQLRNKIARAKENIDAAQRKTVGRKVFDGVRFVTAYFKDEAAVAAAQKNLEACQAQLEQFEEDARKKDIPAGWIRCDK